MKTKITTGDIDIDCQDRNKILSLIDHIPAKKIDGTKHPTGVYVQDIEFSPLTLLANDTYDISPFTKIDFLNLSFLSKFKSNNEIIELMNDEPDWDMLLNPNVVKQLPQIHDHYSLVSQLKPKSVSDLVEILNKIREHSDYKFRKSHGTAYALNIVVMLNYFKKNNIHFDEKDNLLSSDLFSVG